MPRLWGDRSVLFLADGGPRAAGGDAAGDLRELRGDVDRRVRNDRLRGAVRPGGDDLMYRRLPRAREDYPYRESPKAPRLLLALLCFLAYGIVVYHLVSAV